MNDVLAKTQVSGMISSQACRFACDCFAFAMATMLALAVIVI